METLNYLRVIKGERLEESVCDLTDKEIIFEKPREVTLHIFRNDEEQENKFEIDVIMPWNEIFTLSHYKTEQEAREEYERLVKAIEIGERKIKISMTEDFSVSIC